MSKMSILFRRKRLESAARSAHGHRQLARRLSALDLVAIGVGSTIGAGVYILVGTVAREHTGPALPFAFLISGVAAALSAFCYAELACRCPSAGSAYHYSYICLGEGVAWLIGWALILEYTLGGAAAARGISPNLALFFGGEDRFPLLLARQTFFGVVIDPCAAIVVLVMTGLLCIGIKESSISQAVITSVNISALIFVIISGSYLGYNTGWPGYETQISYFPFGVDGFLAGSAAVFFSYVGFDCITSTAEEVKHPQRDLPVGIGISLSICVILYMVVSAVIVGLVPYNALDPDTPISSIFNTYGMRWVEYIITTGAVTALCASLMGALLPQPRILLAMARDGLLPSFFSDVNKHTQVPINSTIVTGMFIAVLTFIMDVSELAGMVSVGTLLAFTIVAISVLILRYVPPEEVSVSSRTRQSSDSVTLQQDTGAQEIDALSIAKHPLLHKGASEGAIRELKRRKVASWCIALSCLGVLVLTSAASSGSLPRGSRFIASGVGAMLIICSLVVLSCTNQADAIHYVGYSGGFLCPWVPFLPVICVLINTYLLINLGASTWIKVSIWLAAGAVIYISYGRSHSLLNKNYALIS